MQQVKMLVLVIFSLFCAVCQPAAISKSSFPDPENPALVARYIVHNTDWLSVATISTQESIKGYPFVGLKSFSDGTIHNGTGIPYIYITPWDITTKDLQKDNRISVMTTLAETDYCKKQNLDPQDPTCAKVIITGKFVKVDESSPEYQFGKKCLFSKHPAMVQWPENHGFFVAKIEPEEVKVMYAYQGMKQLSKEEYLSATLTSSIKSSN